MPWYVFVAAVAFVVAMLVVDLRFFHGEDHEPTAKEAGTWLAVCVAMGIAFGSGIQIALGASGIAVFSSIALGNELSLVFDPLQLAALATAALVATLVARGGETNWLEGLQLLVIYLIVSVAVWLG